MRKTDVFCKDNTRHLNYNGASYEFVPGVIDVESKEFPENIVEQTSMTARIWRADFETLPQIGEKFQIDGEFKRILAIHKDNLNHTVKYALGAEFARI